MWTSFRADNMPGHTKNPLSSLLARMPKAKSPESLKVIELLDDSDDEDTKEQCSVKDSNEEIQEKTKGTQTKEPAAAKEREVAIDNLCNELQEVFKLLRTKEKRKLSDAFESTPELKKRKISDASEGSSRLKSPPAAVVSPNQDEACIKPKEHEETCVECVEEFATAAATNSENENSNFEALLKTAGEEQQRLQDTVEAENMTDALINSFNDCMPPEASKGGEGTPQAEDNQDPNCLAIEESSGDVCSVDLPTNEEATLEETAESFHEPDITPNEETVENSHPEELDEPQDDVSIEYEWEETWDSPVNAIVSTTIQWIKDILPPSIGSFFLFVSGLYCVSVDSSAPLKLALCLLVYCVNVGNAVEERETGDQPVFCVSLPTNGSKSWRALVLSFYTIGGLGLLNLVSAFGDKLGDRIRTQMQQA
ncbi:unnamed protein product [Cylindrotheca closterium]|uniref:Uncharacterized protein n=1 Tax=Cylindrotheca closterium TaxID=2856 RepID=A0AAD2CXI1_9STRA|nr:unnamed protein product [Cylindrotheca closterium]